MVRISLKDADGKLLGSDDNDGFFRQACTLELGKYFK